MRWEEPRTGRVADKEFQFWECWECDANVPEAPPERHWFRSDSGMEAPTYDHMLQKLYRRALGLPENNPPAASCTNEWDRRVAHTVRVDGEDVVIEIIEHYTEENGSAPVSVKVRGPNGLVTSSYQETCAGPCRIDGFLIPKSQDVRFSNLETQDIGFKNGKNDRNLALSPLN